MVMVSERTAAESIASFRAHVECARSRWTQSITVFTAWNGLCSIPRHGSSSTEFEWRIVWRVYGFKTAYLIAAARKTAAIIPLFEVANWGPVGGIAAFTDFASMVWETNGSENALWRQFLNTGPQMDGTI